MTVAIYVSNKKDAQNLIPWGIRFAHSDHTELLIVCPKRSKGKRGWNSVEQAACDESELYNTVFSTIADQDAEFVILREQVAKGQEQPDLDRVLVDVRELEATHPEQAFAEEISSLEITLLLLPAFEPVRAKGGHKAVRHSLYFQAPCDTALLRGPAPASDQALKILVATRGRAETDVAIERARQLAQTFSGTVTILYVRPNDDIVAARIAKRNLRQIIDRSTGMQDCYEQKIALAPNLIEGIKKQNLEEYSLVLVGSKDDRLIQKVFGRLHENGNETGQTVATIRKGIPLTTRAWAWFKQSVRSKVPQMERDQRVELVDRLQNNSKFDFDFIALISLSTLIAALGLMRDSSSVVIGAMLVAPLMTPLVGIGFALIQGNFKLIRDAMRSVVLGFAVAFAIGMVLGFLVPGVNIQNDEISGRGHPNLLDLVVALASGIAGAYAMGRPNLVGALPGVAIAAALVPPIASSGIAFAHFDFLMSTGALLLFLTNIVYIVLGTTIAFWAIGLDNSSSLKNQSGSDRAPDAWPQYCFIAFAVISFILAATLGYWKL